MTSIMLSMCLACNPPAPLSRLCVGPGSTAGFVCYSVLFQGSNVSDNLHISAKVVMRAVIALQRVSQGAFASRLRQQHLCIHILTLLHDHAGKLNVCMTAESHLVVLWCSQLLLCNVVLSCNLCAKWWHLHFAKQKQVTCPWGPSQR